MPRRHVRAGDTWLTSGASRFARELAVFAAHNDEFELYEALQRTFFLDGINDVRKAFADRAKSAKNRVSHGDRSISTSRSRPTLASASTTSPSTLKVDAVPSPEAASSSVMTSPSRSSRTRSAHATSVPRWGRLSIASKMLLVTWVAATRST